MRKIITISIIVIGMCTIATGQCTSLFSFTTDSNKVSFLNQSTISNVHYFWNFGDGTGSNFVNPIHTFPDNGNYLVTLFAEDTVSKCTSYYDYQVEIIKDTSGVCQSIISDSIYTSLDSVYLNIYNTASKCNDFPTIIGVYYGGDFQRVESNQMPIKLQGWQNIPFHMVSHGAYYDRFGNFLGGAYKTIPYKYSSSHNYGDCSANFEFTVVSRDSSGERILYTAMNKAAISYEWLVYGFGNPISSNSDTISLFYPYSSDIYVTGLIIQGSNGCYDTIYQNIALTNSGGTVLGINAINPNTEKLNVYPNPSNGTFTIDASINNYTLIVTNMLGQVILSRKINEGKTIISLSTAPNGMYFVQEEYRSGIAVQKIIITK